MPAETSVNDALKSYYPMQSIVQAQSGVVVYELCNHWPNFGASCMSTESTATAGDTVCCDMYCASASLQLYNNDTGAYMNPAFGRPARCQTKLACIWIFFADDQSLLA